MPTSMRTKLANLIIFYSIFSALFIFIIRQEPNEQKSEATRKVGRAQLQKRLRNSLEERQIVFVGMLYTSDYPKMPYGGRALCGPYPTRPLS